MKLLVIGSKGFIGQHIHDYFKKNNHVYGCDVMVDYVDPDYFQMDSSTPDYYQIFEKNKFDCCINCSGAASVPDSLLNPYRDYILNTVNVYKMLDAIRKHNPTCKFVNLSSAAVYGNPSVLPITEVQPRHPLSPYGIHKLQAEEICLEFSNYFSIPTCSVRIFSAYGPGLMKQLFWDLSRKCEGVEHMDLYGTGNESRDFIYIEDLVHAIERVLDKGKFEGEAINVANGSEVTIRKAVEIFYAKYGWKGKVNFGGQERKGDPLNWVADISRIKELGYTQTVSFEEGIERYVTWLKEKK